MKQAQNNVSSYRERPANPARSRATSEKPVRIGRGLALLVRLILAFIAMFGAYLLGTMVIGETSMVLTPEEMRRAGQAVMLVSLINALLLSFLILRARWHGMNLICAVFIIQFGVETFLAQIETLYFNRAVQMETSMLLGIVSAGAVRALIFAPLAVAIFGKIKRPENSSVAPAVARTAALPASLGKHLAALAGFYVVVYFMFGYFVAWQWEETRLYYEGTTAIKPFFTHFWDLFRTDPIILPFQLLRGALWTGLAFVIVRMMVAKRWEASLAVALTFSGLLGLPIGLFPNPYMPAMVRQAHFIELISSMFLFGGITGWALHTYENRMLKPTS